MGQPAGLLPLAALQACQVCSRAFCGARGGGARMAPDGVCAVPRTVHAMHVTGAYVRSLAVQLTIPAAQAAGGTGRGGHLPNGSCQH